MPRLAGIAIAITAFLLSPEGAQSASLTVYPVRVVLTTTEPVQTMTVQNAGAETSRIQLRVFAWRQDNGEDVFEETRDVLANPGLFEIAVKDRQIARFGLRTSPGTIEKSYRAFLEEIPNARPGTQGEVRTLLRISIPIFVPAPDAKSHVIWRLEPVSDRKAMLVIRNTGSAHIQINMIAISRRDGTKLGGTNSSVYILPGATQRIPVQVGSLVRAGEYLKLNAATDQGNLVADLAGETISSAASRP